MSFATVLRDIRFSLRLFSRNPGFFALLLLVLVLGIGSTTAMSSIMDHILWRPLPYRQPEQLLMLWGKGTSNRSMLYREFQALAREAHTLQEVSAVAGLALSFVPAGRPPELVLGARVSGDFLRSLGISPIRGRLLSKEDDRTDAPAVAVLSEDFWRRSFGADPDIVGKTVRFYAKPYTVVGIAPAGFHLAHPLMEPADVWLGIGSLLRDRSWFATQGDWHVVARRHAEVSTADVQAELQAITQRPPFGSSPNGAVEVQAEDLQDALVKESRAALWLRFAAIALLFLLVCSNTSGLLLVRAEARRTELAARAAFGATRARLVQQLVTEALVLFVVAAPLSALAAHAFVEVFRSYSVNAARPLARVLVSPDLRIWLLCFSLCALVGVLVGLGPALSGAKTDLLAVLRQSSTAASPAPAQQRWRGTLVMVQVALTFVLVTGTGLSGAALIRVLQTPLGFESQGLVMAALLGTRETPNEGRGLDEKIMERLAATPGISAVGFDMGFPFYGYPRSYDVEIEGRSRSSGQHPPVAARSVVSTGYLDTMRIPLLQGRSFMAADDAAHPRVALVNRTFVDRYFPGTSPLGQRVRFHDVVTEEHFGEIVGVVGDVQGLNDQAEPTVFFSVAQHWTLNGVIVARAEQPEEIVRQLPAIIGSIEPELLVRTSVLDERLRRSVSESIRVTTLLSVFGAVALALSALSLYALVSYSTTRKLREFAIRHALGSPPASVVWLAMRGGLRPLLAGVALGLAAAMALGKSFALLVPQARSFDPFIFGVVTLTLAATGCLAILVPALRAARVSLPLALKCE